METRLFPEFAGLWVPLCTADSLGNRQALAFVVAGQRIVLFRDDARAACALIDRCPHRGVALSLGRIESGLIECPFHGWRFDGQGQCRHVPWNPDARRDQLAAIALPLREAGGLLWLFTGIEAVGEPLVPDVLSRPGTRVTSQDFTWDVHWTRVMENMLDTPHLPFVHARSIGKRLRGRTGELMEMSWHETPGGAAIIARRVGEPPRTSLDYHFPNMMELAIDPGGRLLRLLAVCNPAEAGKTRLTLYTVRDFAMWRLFDPLFARANARIAREDQAILESALPAEVPLPGMERSVASDAPTLAFRKIWFNRIRPG
jgi:phenylpropionate dioxygenase-like ring-hydroxylating dioxygenase large terminal subunit